MRLPNKRWEEPFVYHAPVLADRPVRVVFGVGSLNWVGREVARLGRRALLIAGGHEQAAADVVAQQLGDGLVGQLRDVAQHVPAHLAAEATRRVDRLGADVLLTLGGGSATGMAKAIARETGLPILAVPTTYAGSEMTPIWGLSDEQGKTTGRDPRVLPRTVLYDPALTLSLPRDITGPSGINALAHALEALYAPDATPQLTTVAEEALRTLAAALPLVVAHPDDLGARSQALCGAWLAGWALGATTMGLHHKLAHVLGGAYRLPHAGVHSALLPQVAAFNATAAPEAFTRAARALHVDDASLVGAALFDLATEIDAPTSLARLGLTDDAIDPVAETVVGAGVVNPRPVTGSDLVLLLRNAYAGTRP
ncbi:MAG: maleylacetate reductase [Actinomycetota bacterium]|nr:maleylacetate reductase [Actinomycetota bacterium]